MVTKMEPSSVVQVPHPARTSSTVRAVLAAPTRAMMKS